jgi:toxin-antitoxin system PIN domain toxin
MFVVDTNVLIYAADSDARFHTECRALLDEWRGSAGAWYVTWGVVYEFLAVSTHPRTFRQPWAPEQSWEFLRAVLDAPGLDILVPTSRYRDVLAETMTVVPGLTGVQWHDVRTAALMREHGIQTIYTRDTDFHRFPFLRVVDPTA